MDASGTPASGVPPDGVLPSPGVAVHPFEASREAQEAGSGPAPGTRDPVFEVVDAAGAPVAGALVAIRRHGPEWNQVLWLGTTSAPAGRVRCADFDAVSRTVDGDQWLTAGIAGPHPDAALHRIDPAAVPTGPVRLVLPPSGAVHLRLVDDAGAPFLKETRITLSAVEQDRDVRIRTIPSVRFHVSGGNAVFPAVGLGLRYLALANHPEHRAQDVYFAGPRAPGEVTRMTITFPAAFPSVAFRVLDVEGRPFAGRALFVVLRHEPHHGGGGTSHVWPTTDAGGRSHVILDGGYDPGSRRTMSISDGSPRDPIPGVAVVNLGREFPSGPTDIGDIRLGIGPLLAAGIVVDDAGEPVAGAEIRVRFRDPPGARPERPDIGMPSAMTGDDGRFAVRGEGSSPRIEVSATLHGHLPSDTAAVAAGQEGLRLVLQRAGSVRGRILVEDGLPRHDIRLTLNPGTPPARPSPTATTPGEEMSPDREGNFAWPGIPPGMYELVVRVVGEPAPLATIPAVSVRPAETTTLPGIDLRGKLRTITITVLASDGTPVQDGRLTLKPADGSSADMSGHVLEGRPVTVLTAAATVGVLIAAHGFRLETVDGIAADREIRLREALRVRLKLSESVVLPPPPAELRIRLAPRAVAIPEGGTLHRRWYSNGMIRRESTLSGHGWSPYEFTSLRIAPARDALVPVPDPGDFPVLVSISSPRGDAGLQDSVPATITVADVTGEQVFTISWPPEAMAAALARIQR